MLLDAIRRVAINTAPAKGVAENQLPEVNVLDEATPPTLNDPALTCHLKQAWTDKLGAKTFDVNYVRSGLGAEDLPFFNTKPNISSDYFTVGGTSKAGSTRRRQAGRQFPVTTERSSGSSLNLPYLPASSDRHGDARVDEAGVGRLLTLSWAAFLRPS